jgi:hypothetical protein
MAAALSRDRSGGSDAEFILARGCCPLVRRLPAMLPTLPLRRAVTPKLRGLGGNDIIGYCFTTNCQVSAGPRSSAIRHVASGAALLSFIHEHEERTRLWIFTNDLPGLKGQGVKRFAHVLWGRAHNDANRRGEHQRAVMTSSSRRSVPASTSGGMRNVAPSGNINSNAGGVALRATSTGRAPAAFTSTNGTSSAVTTGFATALRASVARRYFQFVSVVALTPSSAANSVALRPLSAQRSTRFVQVSLFSRAMDARDIRSSDPNHDADGRTRPVENSIERVGDLSGSWHTRPIDWSRAREVDRRYDAAP